MKLFSSKKASVPDILLQPVVETLLVIGVVGLLLFVGINKITDETNFNKRFLSEDISLMIDTIYAMPETVYMGYDQDTKNFTFRFNKNKLIITGKKGEASFTHYDYFIEDENVPLSYSNQEIEKESFELGFLKQNNVFKIGNKEDIKLSRYFLVCPNVDDKKDMKDSSFLLIPEESKQEELGQLTLFLKSRNLHYESFDVWPYSYDENKDIIIELDVLDDEDKLTILYDSSSLSSKSAACVVFNDILSRTPAIVRSNLIPTDKSYFNYEANDILMAIKLPKGFDSSMGEKIDEGLEKYFQK